MVLATSSDPRSFNAIIAKETSTTAITGLIFEGLTRTNGVTLDVEPNLAHRWEVSPDGKIWTFTLREDIEWSDGEPFDADDVVFTFNQLIFNPAIPNSARDTFTIDGKIFDVKKINDYTVQFRLPVKFAPFLRGMGQAILPKHKLKRAVEEGEFNFTWGIDTNPEDIVGTGPYQLEQYVPGQRIVLKRNPRYWKKSKEGQSLPFIEKIIYLIIPSQDITLLKFLEGELDYCAVRGVDYSLVKPQEQQKDFTVYNVGPAFGSNFLVFNQNREIHTQTGKHYIAREKLDWFTDLRFRRAVAHAIDKKRIIQILMNELGYPQWGPMSPSSGYFYNPDLKEYPFDLKKARTLLAEAGYKDRDGNGILEDTKGREVAFNLFTNSGNDDRQRIAAIIRHDLGRLGMKVNFLSLEFNILVQKLNATFDWDAIILGLTGGIEPHFGKNVWESSGQIHMWHPMQESPQTEWEKRIDEIFNQAVQELDRKKRKELYDQWQVIVSRQLPFIYTVLPANIFAIRNKFENLKPTSYGGAFHNLEELKVKEGYR